MDNGVDASQWDRPEWEALREKTVDELAALGCQRWERETKLMLFPASWFPYIPTGYEITTIMGAARLFTRETESADRRYGALAYGIVAR